MPVKFQVQPEQVKAARHLIGWSQLDLAKKAKVAVSTVADFERGQRMPIANNIHSMRKALETAGVLFSENSVGYGFVWTFMTLDRTSTLFMSYQAKDAEAIADFASIFGTFDSHKVSIPVEQLVTQEMKLRVTDFVKKYCAGLPQLKGFEKRINDLPEGQKFLLLPTPPADSAEELALQELLHILNANDVEKEVEVSNFIGHIFGPLLEKYDMWCPSTAREKPNKRKSERLCRFCGRTHLEGATFKKVAHAIPAALGNRHLKLDDECDDCNHFFGNTIEPTLVEILSFQRVTLGIQGRSGHPVHQFDGGRMYRDPDDEKLVKVEMSNALSKEATGIFNISFGSQKPVIMQNFYKALVKIALSVVDEKELPFLQETLKWVRSEKFTDRPLPTISAAIVMLPPDPSAQITLYTRKSDESDLPHIVGEFRLGCYMYVFVIPFSSRDQSDLVGFFDKENFRSLFAHYKLGMEWKDQDYSRYDPVKFIHDVRLTPKGNN